MKKGFQKRIESRVRTDNFVRSILSACAVRDDSWALNVKSRVEYFSRDLHAPECVHHHTCDSNFRTEKSIPDKYSQNAKRRKIGRPINNFQNDAFIKLCNYLKLNEEKQLTVVDLDSKMKDFLGEKMAGI